MSDILVAVWARLRALRSRWRMLRKPPPEFALVVIDLATLVTGAASAATAILGGSTTQAASWAAFGGSVLLFALTLFEYNDEQQSLIEKVIRVDDNPITRFVTHDARMATLILLLGLSMVTAGVKVG